MRLEHLKDLTPGISSLVIEFVHHIVGVDAVDAHGVIW
jgi:hypothetical protein